MAARCPNCGLRLPPSGICEGCRSASEPKLQKRRTRRGRLQKRRVIRATLRWLPLAVGSAALAIALYLLVCQLGESARMSRELTSMESDLRRAIKAGDNALGVEIMLQSGR